MSPLNPGNAGIATFEGLKPTVQQTNQADMDQAQGGHGPEFKGLFFFGKIVRKRKILCNYVVVMPLILVAMPGFLVASCPCY